MWNDLKMIVLWEIFYVHIYIMVQCNIFLGHKN